MFKIGGIYTLKKSEHSCIIYLKEYKDEVFGVTIDFYDFRNLYLSNNVINDQLISLKNEKALSNLYYWHVSNKYLIKNTDGYLGQITPDLFNELEKTLKSEKWYKNCGVEKNVDNRWNI